MNIYERLTAKREDSRELKACMEQTFAKLLSKNTDVEHSDMLLDEIQSGKTRAFTGISVLGFCKSMALLVGGFC